jgi:6-pyruvoyltetrahydropterin/6-carboxytetrahydropterin synthase
VTYTIAKRFTFAASHVLHGLAEGHKCGRLHGHNYDVVVELQADTLGSTGFVMDYGDLDAFAELLVEVYDHRHLNDVVDGQPSAERLARQLYDEAASVLDLPLGATLAAVQVFETPRTMAEYRP